jgi:hypothetical protein
MTSTSRIRETGEKKCVPTKRARRGSASAAFWRKDRVQLPEDVALQVLVLEYSFDDETAAIVSFETISDGELPLRCLCRLLRPEAPRKAPVEHAVEALDCVFGGVG